MLLRATELGGSAPRLSPKSSGSVFLAHHDYNSTATRRASPFAPGGSVERRCTPGEVPSAGRCRICEVMTCSRADDQHGSNTRERGLCRATPFCPPLPPQMLLA